MKKFELYFFDATLFFFAVSVIITMYNLGMDDEQVSIMGLPLALFLVPLLLVNIYICCANSNRLFAGSFNGIILFWIIMVTFNVLFLSINPLTDLIRVYLWPTSFLAAYCLSRKNPSFIDNLIKLFFIIYALNLYSFWLVKDYQADFSAMGIRHATNTIYGLLTIIPLLMFIKRKWLFFIVLITAFIATILSNKRGATVIVLLIMIPSLRNLLQKMKSNVIKVVFTIVAIVLLFLSAEYLSNIVGEGRLAERFADIEETGGSGRVNIWNNIIDNFLKSDFISQIVGHGHYSVSSLGMQTAAHNDFLQVLYDYGIIGFIMYLFIHFILIKKCINLVRKRNSLSYQYIAMYIIFFTMSMVSILIAQQRYLIYMAVFWGALEGCRYKVSLSKEKHKWV